MREIKFRAWDTINNRWLNLEKLYIAITGDVYAARELSGESYGLHQVDIVQFTGLRDKNGKEIYEGDILRITIPAMYGQQSCFEIGPIEFDEERGRFVFRSPDGVQFGLTSKDKANEVIGNIYENPELIKEEK